MVLKKLYYNPAYYASYSVVDNLTYAAKPNFSHNKVVCWVESQVYIQIAVPSFAPKNFNDCISSVTNVDDVWEADLIELRNITTYNNNCSYLLMIIDVLGKYSWVEPLQDKMSNKSFSTRALKKQKSTHICTNGQRQRIYCAVYAEISERKRHLFWNNMQSRY